ncbi:hypothetical protein C1631_019550 [Chryseobacterium phosphatilyticum]|uniref:Lipoprotein n=1 Tax=Chryseobacterium phosphatilyticum TaxID=475075 RepID=A0A316WZZ2_9FLAO|nr:hypothetical protein [Chryseobacterium phosphatilyticum]PWN66915.1 hypothetical protein C1631_019550 [Chryseobacterium phosphatilyticum]
MRNIVFGILIVLGALLSCKSDDESLQRIDQVLNIYMKSNTNPDLLNSKKTGSFTSYFANDSLGDRNVSPVTIPLRMRPDSTFYMEYIAGAKRKRRDSTGPDNPGTGNSYYSVMALGLIKRVNDKPDTIIDRLRIEYRKTPTVFQVSKVYYNDVLQFSKEADQPNSINVVTITK